MQLHTQVVNMTNSMKVIYIVTLPEFSKTQIVTWECHVDEFAKCRYDMILIRDILIEQGLNIYTSEQLIEEGEGPLKGSTSPIIDFGTYKFKDLNTGKFTSEESFKNIYVDEVYEP